MHARISTADVKVQLDVSIGDPITPAPEPIDYPTLRAGHEPVPLRGYPLPVVLAEKLCTALDLGAANTRVRDFDVATLTGLHGLTAADLQAALRATAAHRGVSLRPLTNAIGDLRTARRATYKGFLRRLGPEAEQAPAAFADVVDLLIAFADPALRADLSDDARWDPASRTWH